MNKLEFTKTLSTEPVYKYLVQLLSEHLSKGEKVLWFLSGGSAINIEVEVAKRLPPSPNLAITLIDERYGQVGHQDSNWRQLKEAGFSVVDAVEIPVLKGEPMPETIKDFAVAIGDNLAHADYVVALAGIGPDGHTLGIKPGSPSVETKEMVVGYDWDDYRRITTTAEVIKKIDKIVVYAAGPEKKEQLDKLRTDVAATEQPAQLLKLCPDVTIFSDQV